VITVRVTDNGSPPGQCGDDFRVIVDEPNAAPTLAGIPDQTAVWGTALTATAFASDPEQRRMTFSLDAGAPAGATIDQWTGCILLDAHSSAGPGNYVITVRVTDNGSPPASANDKFQNHRG
jgi:hypothetical protein